MLLTQNLVFNLPFCLVMTFVAAIKNGTGFNAGTIVQYLIALVVVEILGAVIPVQKIEMGIVNKFFPGREPMGMPQFLLPAVILTIIFTVPMTLVMTAVALAMVGVSLSILPFAFLGMIPWMLLAAYISVLIFLPLSMKVSGMDQLGAPPQG
jgi:hypothetical protein